MEHNAFTKVDDNIELRPFTEKDAPNILEIVKENYEHLRPFLDWVTDDYSVDSAKEFIEQSKKMFEEETAQTFAIFYKGKIIGAISFVAFYWNSRKTEIGYWIVKDFEGKGIITKCCNHLINYAFDRLEMNRIEIRCAVENIRSRAVPERLGFKLEGILRQSIWRHTRFFDMAIYAILAEEWENI